MRVSSMLLRTPDRSIRCLAHQNVERAKVLACLEEGKLLGKLIRASRLRGDRREHVEHLSEDLARLFVSSLGHLGSRHSASVPIQSVQAHSGTSHGH